MTNPKARAMPRPDVSLTSALGLPSVYVKDVHKSFGDKEVLRGISLQIHSGEILSLIGPSGAGKSTMLRCLTLLDTFDSGELAYGNVRVCANEPGAGRTTYDKAALKEARRRFGIVFQNYNLFPHYSVLKNVMDAPIVVEKRDPEEVEHAARELLGRLGLSEQADKVPDQLSGGQQQRVAIARALCMRPQVLYFDEATSALDPKLTQDMYRLIRELAGEGKAIGIVTHEMGFAREVSDRVAFLIDGEIVEEGPPEQVLENPADGRTREFLANSKDELE